jgi:hypothetical protein
MTSTKISFFDMLFLLAYCYEYLLNRGMSSREAEP